MYQQGLAHSGYAALGTSGVSKVVRILRRFGTTLDGIS